MTQQVCEQVGDSESNIRMMGSLWTGAYMAVIQSLGGRWGVGGGGWRCTYAFRGGLGQGGSTGRPVTFHRAD